MSAKTTKGNEEFQKFLDLFPEIELPVTLSSEYLEVFSKYNKPIPEILLRKYILNEKIHIPDDIAAQYNPHLAAEKDDEKKEKKFLSLEELDLKIFDKSNHEHHHHEDEEAQEEEEEGGGKTEVEDEYIAAFKIKGTGRFYAVVYIKISLLNYEYILHTFDLNGNTIDKKTIAKMTVDGENIKELVAMIDEDLVILVMEGDKHKDENFDPEKSVFFTYQIDDDGHIVEYKL